jgi:hypothetical protein
VIHTESKRLVRLEVSKIRGLDHRWDRMEMSKETENLRRQGGDQVIQIFGNAKLEGNLTMTNVITYTQFCRIDKLIQRKNIKVRTLFNGFWGVMILSFFGPGMFFITLEHQELTHTVAWVIFLPLKITQFLIKIWSLCEFSNRFFSLEKIHIKRSEMDRNICLSMVDIVLEAAALAIIVYLGNLIDKVLDGGLRDSAGMRTEWWWTGAFGSILTCLCYSIYLLIQMTK